MKRETGLPDGRLPVKPIQEDALLSAHDAAKLLAVPESRLRSWRRSRSGRGPSFIRVGGSVRYSMGMLRAYLAERTTVRTPSAGRFYRKTKIELLGEKHPGLPELVEEQQRQHVPHREIAAAVLEKWGETVSEQVLSNFWMLRVWPKEWSERREAKVQEKG